MVPVLSISSTSTSPAASTARPEVAITLACIMRLMPATPIAESKAPIVVGIRQTSSATSVVTVTAVPALAMSIFSVDIAKAGTAVTVTTLVALLVCLIPTTIGALLSAIGVAGMSRMMQANVIATSGRAVEAAGDVDVLLMDKTGTITLGNRQASAFIPATGIGEQILADAAQLASLADETPEGRSIVVLAKQKFNMRER